VVDKLDTTGGNLICFEKKGGWELPEVSLAILRGTIWADQRKIIGTIKFIQ
jgi:hypothetical protein